jgi:hypothetical protein
MWRATWGPFGDVGNHVEILDVFARGDDPATLYPSTYLVARPFGPNVVSGHLARLLYPLLDASQTARLLLTLYAVTMPLSILALCVSFRRNPWLAVIAVPLTYNTMLSLGAINYLIGLPMVFTALAVARRWTDRSGIGWGVVLTALLLLAFFTHLFIGAMACGFSALLLLVHARRPIDLLRLLAIAPTAVAVSLFVVPMLGVVGGVRGVAPVYLSAPELFADLYDECLRFFENDATDEVVFGVLIALFIVSIFTRTRAPADEESRSSFERLRVHDFRLITGCAFVGWLVLPAHVSRLAVINHRMVVVMWLLFALWAPHPTREGVRRHLVRSSAVILSVIAIAYPWHAGNVFARFEEDVVGELPDAIAALPQATVLGYSGAIRGNPYTRGAAPWHIPAGIHAVENGGVTTDSFAIQPYTPVQYRDDVRPPRHPLDHFWDQLSRLDYVLWRGAEPSHPAVGERLRLLFHEGRWWLYEVRGGRTPMPRRRFVL